MNYSELMAFVKNAIVSNKNVRVGNNVFVPAESEILINGVSKKFKTAEEAGAYFIGFIIALYD